MVRTQAEGQPKHERSARARSLPPSWALGGVPVCISPRVWAFAGAKVQIRDLTPDALGMENSAAETRFKSAMREVNEDVARLLNTLSREDGANLVTLKEFAPKHGIPLT